MQLRQLRLKNFRGFRDVQIDFDQNLTVLVGENGAGKTSVLDALAIMLTHYAARLLGSASRARRLAPGDLRVGGAEARVQLTGRDQSDTDVRWTLLKQGARERLLKPLSSELTDLNDFIRKVAERHAEENDYFRAEGPIVYYDQRRSLIDIPQRKRGSISHEPKAAFEEGLRFGGIDLRKLTYWFQERETDELRRQKSKRGYSDPQLLAVRKAITQATGFRKPYYRIESPRGLCVSKDGVELHVSQLSMGERVFMAMAGDLARRLAILNRSSKNPLLGKAIVLIDEIELHLHPRWQRKIIPWLLETFPNCQLVVSTHSPQVLGEVRADNIRVLTSTKGEIEVQMPRESYGRDSNFLLLRVLGGSERTEQSKMDLQRLDHAIELKRLSEARRILARLRNEIEGAAPELTIAEARLERREREGAG